MASISKFQRYALMRWETVRSKTEKMIQMYFAFTISDQTFFISIPRNAKNRRMIPMIRNKIYLRALRIFFFKENLIDKFIG